LARDGKQGLWRAPAKVNLSLHVLGRRPDGYHDLHSLVAFAGVGDWIAFAPGGPLELVVEGSRAALAGPVGENLVLKAAAALAQRVPGLKLGRFRLTKNLPVAAGLGGGSSDAAAALRALADYNGLAPDDDRLWDAARSTGADVPVCLDPRARVMTGVGHDVGPALEEPPLLALLVNPGVATPTPQVFRGLGLAPGTLANYGPDFDDLPGADGLERLAAARNDLQSSAIAVAPVIAETIQRLAALEGAGLARMSGSGATCFAIFRERRALTQAAASLTAERPNWWVRATLLR